MGRERSGVGTILAWLAAFIAVTMLSMYLVLREYLFDLTLLGRASELTWFGWAEHAIIFCVWLALGAHVFRLVLSAWRK